MNLIGNNVQIMWKDIIGTIVFIYVLRFLIDSYLIIGLKKVRKIFYSDDWSKLKELIEKYLKISNHFSNGPWNNKIRGVYNTLCVFEASRALIEGDNIIFLKQLDQIKKENEFELKFFILFLYYRSKKNNEKAVQCYQKFYECKNNNRNLKLILDMIFLEGKNKCTNQEIKVAIDSFKNPAIIKLLNDNGINSR